MPLSIRFYWETCCDCCRYASMRWLVLCTLWNASRRPILYPMNSTAVISSYSITLMMYPIRKRNGMLVCSWRRHTGAVFIGLSKTHSEWISLLDLEFGDCLSIFISMAIWYIRTSRPSHWLSTELPHLLIGYRQGSPPSHWLSAGLPTFSLVIGRAPHLLIGYRQGSPTFSLVIGRAPLPSHWLSTGLPYLLIGYRLGSPTFSLVSGRAPPPSHWLSAGLPYLLIGYRLGSPTFSLVIGRAPLPSHWLSPELLDLFFDHFHKWRGCDNPFLISNTLFVEMFLYLVKVFHHLHLRIWMKLKGIYWMHWTTRILSVQPSSIWVYNSKRRRASPA